MSKTEQLRSAVIDLLSILDSPHTSVSVRWETGDQYKQAKALCAQLVGDLSPRIHPPEGVNEFKDFPRGIRGSAKDDVFDDEDRSEYDDDGNLVVGRDGRLSPGGDE